MINKKAMLIGTVVSLLVVVIIMIVLITIFSPNLLGSKITTVVDRNVCELSLYLKYSATKATFGLKESGELKCPVEEVEIKNTDEKKTMKILADQMKSCWGKMGEGKIDFLGDIDFGQSDARCLVCSSIITKEDEVKINTKEFSEFLNKNSYKIGTKTTYTSYFLGSENAEIDLGDSEIVLNDKNPTYVIFMATKNFDEWKDQALKDVGGLVAGRIIGGWLLGIGPAKVAFGIVGGVATSLAYKTEFQPTIVIDNGFGMSEKCDRLE